MSYTKLHAEIVQSSVWSEPDHVRIMWITLLSQADAGGYIYGSVVGLARLAVLSVERAQEALDRLQQPDPYSQTKAFDGRRLVAEDVEGRTCYRVVNHAFYRELKSKEERNRRNAERQKRYREKSAVTHTVTKPLHTVTHPSASASASDLNRGAGGNVQPTPAIPGPDTCHENLHDRALTGLAMSDAEWAWESASWADQIAIILDGWKAYSGKQGIPAPKSHSGCRPYLRAIADGRTPEQIRDILKRPPPDDHRLRRAALPLVLASIGELEQLRSIPPAVTRRSGL